MWSNKWVRKETTKRASSTHSHSAPDRLSIWSVSAAFRKDCHIWKSVADCRAVVHHVNGPWTASSDALGMIVLPVRNAVLQSQTQRCAILGCSHSPGLALALSSSYSCLRWSELEIVSDFGVLNCWRIWRTDSRQLALQKMATVATTCESCQQERVAWFSALEVITGHLPTIRRRLTWDLWQAIVCGCRLGQFQL